jgi:hypothetical protein
MRKDLSGLFPIDLNASEVIMISDFHLRDADRL